MARDITREELHQLMASEQVTLVEALPAKYFEQGHLPGAININHDEVESKAPALLPDTDALVVTYCADHACQNSSIAAAKLEALGYKDVATYGAGKSDWLEAGLPTDAGKVAA